MANRKIIDLPIVAEMQDVDTLHISQSGTDKRGTFGFLKDQILISTQDLVNQAEDAKVSSEQILTAFSDAYYGEFAVAPVAKPSGGARVEGDLYYKTTATKGLQVYNGTNWVPISTAQAATVLYSNVTSGLAATNVQDAIDELKVAVDTSGGGAYTTASAIVNIGAGGDYATINEALEYYSQRPPKYDISDQGHLYPNTGIQITLHLLSGFVMTEQVIVYGLNLSWIRITGADAETTVDASMMSTSFGFNGAFLMQPDLPIFGVTGGGFLPIIDQTFRVVGDNFRVCGITAGQRSCAIIGVNSGGIYNVGRSGLYAAQGASIFAKNVHIDGMIVARHGSTINLEDSTVVSDEDSPVSISYGSALYATDSNITAPWMAISTLGRCDISGATINGDVSVDSLSQVDASGATISGDIDSYNSAVTLNYGSASNISVSSGGTLAAQGATGTLSQPANTITANGIIFQ